MKKIDSSDLLGFLIAAAIIAFLIWSQLPSTNNKNTVQSTSVNTAQTSPSYQTQTSQAAPVSTPEPPVSQPVDSSMQNNSESQYQLCSVRLINTLNNTDKTGGYKAHMNEETKTLTLKYVNNPNEVIEIVYNGGGLNTLRFYLNGSLEAEKTMYRRTDLEVGDKQIVYTSRTEQVKVIISYE
ncbi:hypothetical protein C8P68_104324 [Mucilaginibacter yixingensis]|uniref:Uncharacterized protein n=1 Tax=Mucilaginibacter yixingensis TaxID=1295612 RepID=A0A2T5J9T4_9SPHI|nr:hypothetical protein [Mucilaginibacter yixingensis]PTQ96833.1 hypothetical protein C8P68_104324 [Mucilaginibacter yixingensis]